MDIDMSERGGPPDTFVRTFFVGDDPTLQDLHGPGPESRKKRAHRKSRWGCAACKRRKVKCDENAPCSNCVKRREQCSLVAERQQATGTSGAGGAAGSVPSADARVNLLHMELFHHFQSYTVPTLAFEVAWPELIKVSFKEEYLMTAILAVAARHLSILNPEETRYSDAALSLLSKACASFRAILGSPITVENRDAVFGTSILIHYLCWCDVEFLEQQQQQQERKQQQQQQEPGQQLMEDDDDDGFLDLSQDLLFLTSEGIRHVRTASCQLPGVEDSIFGVFLTRKQHNHFTDFLEARGLGPGGLWAHIMDMYDDPRFHGTAPPTPTPNPTPTPGLSPDDTATTVTTAESCDTPMQMNWAPAAEPSYVRHSSGKTWPSAHALAMQQGKKPPRLPADQQQQQQPSEPIVDEKERDRRSSFEIVASRVAIVSRFAHIYESAPSPPPERADPAAPPFGRAMWLELERCFLTLPAMYHLPFVDMVGASDSRVLALMFLLYRAARVLVGGSAGAWWARRRAEVMEGLLRTELERRGLLEVLREMKLAAID